MASRNVGSRVSFGEVVVATEEGLGVSHPRMNQMDHFAPSSSGPAVTPQRRGGVNAGYVQRGPETAASSQVPFTPHSTYESLDTGGRSLNTAYSSRSTLKTNRSIMSTKTTASQAERRGNIFTPALTTTTKGGLTPARTSKKEVIQRQQNSDDFAQYIKDSGIQNAFKQMLDHALNYPPRDIFRFLEQQFRFQGDPLARALLKRRQLRLNGAKNTGKNLEQKVFDQYEKPGVVFISTFADPAECVRRYGAVHAAMLFTKLNQIVHSIVGEFPGASILKVDEDQTFVRFSTCEVTVRAALCIFEALSRWNALQRDPSTFLAATVSACMGKTLVLRDDIWGNGVNVAYKLGKEVASPGEFLITKEMMSRLNIDGRRNVSRRFTEKQETDADAVYFWSTVDFEEGQARFEGYNIDYFVVKRHIVHSMPALRADFPLPPNGDPTASRFTNQILGRLNHIPGPVQQIDASIQGAHSLTGFFFVTHLGRMTYLTKKYGILHPLSTLFKHRGDTLAFVEAKGGMVIKYDGDHLIAHFTSPIDAIEAALDSLEYVDRWMNHNTAGDPYPSDEQCLAKIGISYGTALYNAENNDIFGLPLVDAFELSERNDQPLSLLVSGQVLSMVEQQPRYDFEGVLVEIREDWTLYGGRVSRRSAIPIENGLSHPVPADRFNSPAPYERAPSDVDFTRYQMNPGGGSPGPVPPLPARSPSSLAGSQRTPLPQESALKGRLPGNSRSPMHAGYE